MITFFTCPKAFKGHIGVIQRNALRSWIRPEHGAKLLLLGDDPGAADAAAELGADYRPTVKRNRYGTPLLSDLFAQAHQASDTPYLCYINADILLLDCFFSALARVTQLKRRGLMVGQRCDVDLDRPIEFNAHWQAPVRHQAQSQGQMRNPTFIDYFVFNRGLYEKIPPFAVGRTAFDNWLIYRARKLHVPVVDLSPSVLAVHQNHDYKHATGYKWVWRGPEARLNYQLAGGRKHLFTIWDSTHVLEHGRLVRRGQSGLGGGIWSYRRSVGSSVQRAGGLGR